MKKINVVIFARVSSKTSRQENKRQIEDLEAVAKRNDWNITKIITSKISASKTKRGERGDLVELFETVRSKNKRWGTKRKIPHRKTTKRR